MKLKKGNKSKYEFDYMIVSDNKVCVQIGVVEDRLNGDEKKIIEKHLKTAAEEIAEIRNNHAQ